MPDVFISYSRATSTDAAEAIRIALRSKGVSVFLDSVNIELGDGFPTSIVDAMLATHIIVVLPTPVYFTRWYCLLEWRLARTPFLAACEASGATEESKTDALAGIMLALPDTSVNLDQLPPKLQVTNWPKASEVASVVEVVLRQLDRIETTLADRIDAVLGTGASQAVRERFESESRLPEPRAIRGIPNNSSSIPDSIGDHFVGRADDLWRIDDLLVTRTVGTPGAAALSGALQAPGGIGKSRLALEYLHRFGPRRFPGGLYWVPANTAEAELERIHHDILCTVSADPVPNLAEYRNGSAGRTLASDLQRAFAALPQDRPALVVVDDIPEPAAGGRPKALKTWCPMQGLAAVLITSRFHYLGDQGNVAPLPLDVLTPEASTQLLSHGVAGSASLSEPEWQQVAEWVGRLPLALTLLNAALQSGALSASTILNRARSTVGTTRELDATMEALRPNVAPGALRGISEAFLHAYNSLSAGAQVAARLLAQGAPLPIPEALIDRLGRPVSSPEVRAALVIRSFVTRVSGGGQSFGFMHSVLADFLRTQASGVEGEKEALKFASAVSDLFKANPATSVSNWPILSATAPHGLAVAARLGTHTIALAVRIGIADWLGVSGGEEAARDAFAVIARDAEANHGRDAYVTLEAKGHWARWTGRTGDVAAAIRLLQEVLDDFPPIANTEQLVFNQLVRSNLARWMLDTDRVKEAYDILPHLLEEMLQVSAKTDPAVLTIRSLMAEAVGRLGHPTAARDQLQQLLKDRLLTLERSDYRLFTTRNNLGYWTAAAGDKAEAIKILESLQRDLAHKVGTDSLMYKRTSSLLEGLRASLK